MTQAAESACPPRSRLHLFIGFFYFIPRLRILFYNIFVSLVIRTFACESFSIATRSVQLIRAPQIGSVAEFSAPRPPPTASPLPIPLTCPAGAGRQPVPVPGHGSARHGPARDVTSRVTASRWPCRGVVTMGRDHRPPALSPGPLPNRCPLFGVRRCARAPTGVSGPKSPDPALSQIESLHGDAG